MVKARRRTRKWSPEVVEHDVFTPSSDPFLKPEIGHEKALVPFHKDGYTEDEIIGTEFTRYIHPDELSKVADHYRRRIAGEHVPSIYETIFLRKDGSKLYAEVNAALINYQGNPADLVIARDITERKQAEDALRKAHEELHRFTQGLEKKVQERTEELREKSRQLVRAERLAALGEMAERVAHELRNPLTVIGGFARRMHDKMPDNDPNRKYLKIILEEVMDLEKKISEIVTIEEDE